MKPGLLQFMGLQRIRHDLVTEQQQLNVQAPPILVDNFSY